MTSARRAAIRTAGPLDPARRTHFRLARPDMADAGFIAGLRNDPGLNRHLNASATSVAAQLAWLQGYAEREAVGEEFYFVIMCDGASKGVVRMYDFQTIDGQSSFCWGSWIIAPPPVPGLATYTATAIYALGFDALGLDQSHFDVRAENEKVIGFHLRSGALPAGAAGHDRYFVFPRAAWPAFRTASERHIARHGRSADPS